MESFVTLLPILLLIVAVAVLARLAINKRKRRHQIRSKAVEQPQLTVIAELPVAAQSQAAPEEAKPTLPQGMPPTAIEKVQPTIAQEAERRRPQTAAEELQPVIPEEPRQTTLLEAQPTAPEETEQIVTKDAQQKVMQKAPLPPMPETQITTVSVEKAKSTVTQKTQPTEEEIRRPERGQARSMTPESKPPLSGGERRKPIDRGGKPRSSTTDHKKYVPEREVRIPKPEIVCWKKERQWIPGVEVPEELLEKPGLSVLQNESSLLKDESEEAFWHLNQAIGKVIVRWNEDEGVREIEIGQEGYLLFKLSGERFNQGRLVKSPSSSGLYLVVTPEEWERDETLSGPPPVRPESVSLAGYSAHFFDLDKSSGQKIAFRLPDGRSLAIEAKAPRFELIGRRLKDANELVGPLFGEAPPRIRALDAQAWRNIRTVVVGEEGRGRRRWRMRLSRIQI